MGIRIRDDPVFKDGFFLDSGKKSEPREFVSYHAKLWIDFLKNEMQATGAVMIDIDDTLIDGKERVDHGFEHMYDLYQYVGLLYPMHIVTARPKEDHAKCMKMLKERGFTIPPDRLHMLPSEHYGKDDALVVDFKWKTFLKIADLHGGVVGRFGDRLWDVAHRGSLSTYLSHIPHKSCYIFKDKNLGGCVSYKLPG